MIALPQFRIAIVAPFPHPHVQLEGWMTRISSIDYQFKGIPRIYLNFSESHDDSRFDEVAHDDERSEVLLNPLGKNSAAFMSELTASVVAIYVHTLHLAEHILPWLNTGKVYVDIHGVTPEEEESLGNVHLRGRYEIVEEAVLQRAHCCICVSEAMAEHYGKKYPLLRPNWLTIPITATLPSDAEIAPKPRTDDRRPVAVYSGGIQAWQNLDAMLDLVESMGSEVDFRFLSHEHAEIQRRIEGRKLTHVPEIGFCNKSELPAAYRAAEFGLILRNASPVNRVSCPTKLVEYLMFGLIPVIRTPHLGDFHNHGYFYITEDELREGFIPDAATRDWMAEENLGVLRHLADQFRAGTNALRSMILTGGAGTGVANEYFRDLRHFRRSVLDRYAEYPCDVLEVGAFHSPTVNSSEANVKFLDFFATDELKSMARRQGQDSASVVHVDFVCKTDDFTEVVNGTFDVLIANHVLEHVDYFIQWLQMARKVIRDDGVLFLVLPDKKKGFDKFRPDTPLSHLLFEHLARDQDVSSIHNLETFLYYDNTYIGKTNDPGTRLDIELLARAIDQSHPGVHRHVFQAETFPGRILKPLLYTNLIDYELLEIVNCSQYGEFAVVLKAGRGDAFRDPGNIFSPAIDTVLPAEKHRIVGDR